MRCLRARFSDQQRADIDIVESAATMPAGGDTGLLAKTVKDFLAFVAGNRAQCGDGLSYGLGKVQRHLAQHLSQLLLGKIRQEDRHIANSPLFACVCRHTVAGLSRLAECR